MEAGGGPQPDPAGFERLWEKMIVLLKIVNTKFMPLEVQQEEEAPSFHKLEKLKYIS